MPYGKTDHRPFLPTPVRFGRILVTPSCTRWLYFLAALSATFFMFQVVDYLQRATAESNREHPQNYDAIFTMDRSTLEYENDSIKLLLDFVNSLGSQRRLDGSGFVKQNLLQEGLPENFREQLNSRAKSVMSRLPKAPPARAFSSPAKSTTINLAVVACENRGRDDAKTMLKSALLFSQDARLHAFVFSDNATIPSLAVNLLELKWISAALGWDFTFTLHPEWFPADSDVSWKQMWAPCSTQRLFLPSMIPEADAAIYLDTDLIIVSNLTDLWLNFEQNMTENVTVAMAANNEKTHRGHYGLYSKIPYYGQSGVQAGVVLMNLTRMREFNIEKRSVAAYQLYHEMLDLADQDIYNIIFHTFKERMFLLDCTYDFTHIHCGDGPKQTCIHHDEPGPLCFCNSTLTDGVRIVHGNGRTFRPDWPFLFQLQQAFKKLDLLTDDPILTIKDLMRQFDNLEEKPACFGLTSWALYGNAIKYLKQLKILNTD